MTGGQVKVGIEDFTFIHSSSARLKTAIVSVVIRETGGLQ